jgi:DNA polymerase IV
MRGERRERITEGRLLEAQSERGIFDILGVPWRPPEHRRC